MELFLKQLILYVKTNRFVQNASVLSIYLKSLITWFVPDPLDYLDNCIAVSDLYFF